MPYVVIVNVDNVVVDSTNTYVANATFSYTDNSASKRSFGSSQIGNLGAPVWFSFYGTDSTSSDPFSNVQYIMSSNSQSNVKLTGAKYSQPGAATISYVAATTTSGTPKVTSVLVPCLSGTIVSTRLEFSILVNGKTLYFSSADPESKNLGT